MFLEARRFERPETIAFSGLGQMIFEWDEDKDSSNLEKHGVGLSDGISVFNDPNRVDLLDDRFDYGEDRFITIGMNESTRVLTVA